MDITDIVVTEEMVYAGARVLMRAAEGLPGFTDAALSFAGYLSDVYRAMRALEPSGDSEESVKAPEPSGYSEESWS